MNQPPEESGRALQCQQAGDDTSTGGNLSVVYVEHTLTNQHITGFLHAHAPGNFRCQSRFKVLHDRRPTYVRHVWLTRVL